MREIGGKYGMLLLCVVVMWGCAYHAPDEDWEKNGKVRLNLDWQTRSSYPTGMTYYFYKDGTGRPVIRQGSSSGYEGTLPSGQYKVAVCNADPTNLTLEMNDGYDHACGKVHQVSALKSLPVHVAHPGNLYGTGCFLTGVTGEEAVVEELYPVGLVKTLELNIRLTGVDKLSPVGLSGRLTGVSSHVHIPSGKPLFDMPAFMLFEPEAGLSEVYTSSLSMFGLSEGGDGADPAELYLTLKTKDGREITSFTDVTKDISNAFNNGLSAHIILDLTVAYDEINGLGITVTGWKEGTGEAGN